MKYILVLLLCTLTCVAQNTTQTVVQLTPVSWGTASNVVRTPTDFNRPVLRLTGPDLPDCGAGSSFEVTPTGGNNDRIWSVDSRWLLVNCVEQGAVVVVQFDPGKMRRAGTVTGLKIGYPVAFDGKQKGLVWHVAGTLLQSYALPATAPVTVFDFATCTGWPTTGGVPKWTGAVSSSALTGRVMTIFSLTGPQDTGTLVAAYDPAQRACWLYDTAAGTVNGAPVTLADRFTVHDGFVYNGDFAMISPGTCLTGTCAADYFWQVGTTTVNPCTVNCGGHNYGGTTQAANTYNHPQMIVRTYTAPDVYSAPWTPAVSFVAAIDEMHCGWQTSAWNGPVFCTTALTKPVSNMTEPFENEVTAWFPDTGKFVRIAHTGTSGSNPNWRTQQGIAAASPDGRWVAFSSDMGNPARSDVYVVQVTKPSFWRRVWNWL